jgi:hypothetical protein
MYVTALRSEGGHTLCSIVRHQARRMMAICMTWTRLRLEECTNALDAGEHYEVNTVTRI